MWERGEGRSPVLLRSVWLVTVLGAVSAWGAAGAQEQPTGGLSAEQLVGKMAEAFKGVQTLQTTGTTQFNEQAGGRTQTAQAAFELRLERPNRLYFKTWQQAGGFLVVWDGSVGWISTVHTNQYQKHEGVADLLHFLPRASAILTLPSLPLSYVHNLLLPDPKVGLTDGVTQTKLLSPQDSATYSLMLTQRDGEVVTLSVGKDDFLLRGILFDLTAPIRGQATQAGRTLPVDYRFTVGVTFADVTVNKPIEQTVFSFSPPEGAALVTQFGPQPLTGKDAPDFTLNDLSGKPVTLSALRGEVVLLEFWATGSAPCQAALPQLEKLHQDFGGKGLTVLGVSGEEKETVESFLKDHQVTFATLLDPKGVAVAPYQVTVIPRTLIIDREGKVAADFTGLQQDTALRAKLAELGIK